MPAAEGLVIKFEQNSDQSVGGNVRSINYGFAPDFTEIDIEMPHVLPSDSYFQDRETDEKLLAIREEQEQFTSIEDWQQLSGNDVPSPDDSMQPTPVATETSYEFIERRLPNASVNQSKLKVILKQLKKML